MCGIVKSLPFSIISASSDHLRPPSQDRPGHTSRARCGFLVATLYFKEDKSLPDRHELSPTSQERKEQQMNNLEKTPFPAHEANEQALPESPSMEQEQVMALDEERLEEVTGAGACCGKLRRTHSAPNMSAHSNEGISPPPFSSTSSSSNGSISSPTLVSGGGSPLPPPPHSPIGSPDYITYALGLGRRPGQNFRSLSAQYFPGSSAPSSPH